jgi:hypothetical protein
MTRPSAVGPDPPRPINVMSWQLVRLPSRRPLSTAALHFYQNRQLDIFAAKEAHRLTLRQLVHDFPCSQPAPAHTYPRSSLDAKSTKTD